MSQGYGGKVDRDAVLTCQLFLRVAKVTLEFFYTNFQAHDLSPGQYSTLLVLLAEPAHQLSPSDIAERVGVSRPAATGLIEKLIKKRFVKRSVDHADRRSMTVSLTDKGRAYIVGYLPDQFQLMASLVKPMSQSKRRVLTDVLVELEHKVKNQKDKRVKAKSHG